MRGLIIAACVLLTLSPIDLNPIPDVDPLAGWADDAIAGLVGLMALMTKTQPKLNKR